MYVCMSMYVCMFVQMHVYVLVSVSTCLKIMDVATTRQNLYGAARPRSRQG